MSKNQTEKVSSSLIFFLNSFFKKSIIGVPRLRIRRCHRSGLGRCCGRISSLETSGQKKKKKKKSVIMTDFQTAERSNNQPKKLQNPNSEETCCEIQHHEPFFSQSFFIACVLGLEDREGVVNRNTAFILRKLIISYNSTERVGMKSQITGLLTFSHSSTVW